jgi:hypothetical protein
MRKGWLIYAIVVGVAATLIAWVIISLVNTVHGAQSAMMDQLSKDGTLGSIGIDEYVIANGPFFLGAVSFLLLEFATGMVSFLLTRPAGGKVEKSYAASIIAGLFPAALWGIFYFGSWLISLSQYESHASVRPSEPALPCMAVGLIVFEMAVCVLASVAGGWLSDLALKRDSNSG